MLFEVSHPHPSPSPSAGASAYDQRQAGIKLQLDDLKAQAQEAHAAALATARAEASSSGRLGDGNAADVAPLRARIETAIVAMSEGLIERDTEVRLLLLAALSGEHILYIGPPGTAKSELGRRLSRLTHGRYFERLLTRFSVPEELFGPLSMRALEEDRYLRQTAGYLPEATVAFIDEIFKANSAILNTLLTVLNERLFDNGADRVRVPLLCLVGASNELPESEELDALYDRFLIRRLVSQVTPAGLLEMLSRGGARRQAGALAHPGEGGESDHVDTAPLLTADDFEETRARAEAAVTVPPDVLNIIADLRAFLQDKCEPPVYVSDRRLVKAVGLMQVAAYSSGRTCLADYDTLLLRHVLWQRPGEGERIYEWLLTSLASDDGMQQMQYLLSGLFGRACKGLGDPAAVASLAQEVGSLRETLTARLGDVYASTLGGLASGQTLWLGEDEAEAVGSALLPKLEKTVKDLEALLFEVVTLEVSYS
jgi:MoxR-like ATPase